MYLSAIGLAVLVVRPALATITCETVGATATASWTNKETESCTWVGVVGSNFGTTASGGDYSCNGRYVSTLERCCQKSNLAIYRCGTGCTGEAIGNAYTQHCFSHDICSYFNNATGGASDPNCGAAFDAAIEDFLFGEVDGCDQTNPTIAPEVPTVQPSCS